MYVGICIYFSESLCINFFIIVLFPAPLAPVIVTKILLIFMPLYYYEPTFFRFFRNMLFVNYIYISKIFDKTEKNYKDVITIIGMIVCFALLVFLSQFVFFGKGFNYLGVPIFEANRFIGE